jgi:hypothetical protein
MNRGFPQKWGRNFNADPTAFPQVWGMEILFEMALFLNSRT